MSWWWTGDSEAISRGLYASAACDSYLSPVRRIGNQYLGSSVYAALFKPKQKKIAKSCKQNKCLHVLHSSYITDKSLDILLRLMTKMGNDAKQSKAAGYCSRANGIKQEITDLLHKFCETRRRQTKNRTATTWWPVTTLQVPSSETISKENSPILKLIKQDSSANCAKNLVHHILYVFYTHFANCLTRWHGLVENGSDLLERGWEVTACGTISAQNIGVK